MTTYPTAIGRLLKDYRLRHNLSQHKLGDILSVDHAFVSRIEAGTRYPHPSQVAHYARCLDLPEVDIALAICDLDPQAVREELAAELRPVIFRELLATNLAQAESMLRMYDRALATEPDPDVQEAAA